MRTEEELLEIFKKVNLDSYVGKIEEETFKNSIQLTTLDDLIRFTNKHNIGTIFYHFRFADRDAYFITNDTIKRCSFDEDDLYILQDKFDEYNERLSKIAIDNPVYLTIYCIYQGIVFSVGESNNWFFERGFDTPLNICDQLYEEFYDDIVEVVDNMKQLYEDDRDKLYQKLLVDEDFHKCTNIQARRIFTNELEYDDEIKKIFSTKAGGYQRMWLKDFIEEVWREYKQSLKKKK